MTELVLITGANKGLGYETARRLGDLGLTVLIAARDDERGSLAAEKLRAEGADARFVRTDVTSDDSVARAAEQVRRDHGHLDVLVNNAGILGDAPEPVLTGPDDFRAVYETNVFGVVRVTRAFVPLLERADHPRVVMVSSGMGSMTRTTDPAAVESGPVSLVYPSSKAALNMVTTQYAKALPAIRVNAVDPGYTDTDFNGHRGHKPVQRGADAIVTMATVGPEGPTGAFVDDAGTVPW